MSSELIKSQKNLPSRLMLKKPTEHAEVEAQQPDTWVYAEDINQLITNVEILKGGPAAESPIISVKELNIKADDINQRLNNEITNRTNTDNSLLSQINSLNENLKLETSERKKIDTNIENQVTELKNNLNTESQNRKNKDDNLQEQITTLKSNLQTEEEKREEEDNNLQSQIIELTSTLNKETENRTSEDNKLKSQITTLESNLNAEIGSRIEEDTLLKSSIDSLNQNLILEVQNRKEEDTGLQNQINDLNNNKQNNLTAGYNVHLEDDIISLKGGVSKNYIPEEEYRVNDFIFHENRLYRVNRVFISSEWNTDKSYLTLVSANDVASVATEVAYNNGTTGLAAKNVQEAIDKILLEKINIETLMNHIVPIGCTYYQLANDEGIFLEEEAPENLYPDTIWQLKYANEAVYLRTEGSLSESGRTNGLQGDAGRNATGGWYNLLTLTTSEPYAAGIIANSTNYPMWMANEGNGRTLNYCNYNIRLDRAYTTANEFRTINRLMRMYKRIA